LTALSRLAIPFRTVAAAGLVVAASGALVRTTVAAFDPFEAYPGHTADYGVARARAVRAALPDIAERPEKTVVVLGSSGLTRAFVPSMFDASLGRERYVSFNLAQLLLQPETARAMAASIREAYEARSHRLGMAIVGVSVPELTRDSLRAARRKVPDQAFAFETPGQLVDRARTEPLDALSDGLTHLFFGDVRPERLGLWLEDWARARPSPCESGLKQPPEGPEAYAELVSFCEELHQQFPRGVPPWNPRTRGGLDFGLPATRPMIERLVALQPSSVSAPKLPPAPDVADDVDEGAVRAMIGAVRELRAVSDHTFVFREPENPALAAPMPEVRLARRRAVAARIAREGDATLLDLDGAFVPSDFGDRTHLHPLAAERFSSLLAAKLTPIVQEHRASR
jgi:hypothetical protein